MYVRVCGGGLEVDSQKEREKEREREREMEMDSHNILHVQNTLQYRNHGSVHAIIMQ